MQAGLPGNRDRIGYSCLVIDVKDLSENPDKFRASQRARGADDAAVDAIIAADSARRAALIRFENLRAEQNAFGKKVAQAKGEEKQALLAEVKVLAASVKAASADADVAQSAHEELLRRGTVYQQLHQAQTRERRRRAPARGNGNGATGTVTWRQVNVGERG